MQAVIFDMDGVLVDSEPLYNQHIKSFLVKLGVQDSGEIVYNFKGLGSKEVSRIIIETFNLDHDIDEMTKMSRHAYIEHLNDLAELPSIPGAVELVKNLAKAGHPLALASAASSKRIEMFLNKLDLTDYFKIIASGEDVERTKPAPDIFLLAARKLGVDPKECVVIEDAANGVTAAKAAGMKCIAYGGSDHNTDNLLDADLVVKDFTKFVNALKPGKLPV